MLASRFDVAGDFPACSCVFFSTIAEQKERLLVVYGHDFHRVGKGLPYKSKS